MNLPDNSINPTSTIPVEYTVVRPVEGKFLSGRNESVQDHGNLIQGFCTKCYLQHVVKDGKPVVNPKTKNPIILFCVMLENPDKEIKYKVNFDIYSVTKLTSLLSGLNELEDYREDGNIPFITLKLNSQTVDDTTYTYASVFVWDNGQWVKLKDGTRGENESYKEYGIRLLDYWVNENQLVTDDIEYDLSDVEDW